MRDLHTFSVISVTHRSERSKSLGTLKKHAGTHDKCHSISATDIKKRIKLSQQCYYRIVSPIQDNKQIHTERKRKET